MQDARPLLLGDVEQVQRAENRGLERVQRIGLVFRRRGRAGQVVDPVDRPADGERHDHVMLDPAEPRMADQRADVLEPPGREIVDTDHPVPLIEQPSDQVGADETGPARHQNCPSTPPGGLVAPRVEADRKCLALRHDNIPPFIPKSVSFAPFR
ncbi:hypothetical protein SDC9_30395 [bioreactor metagenome]|uniref:Uncharacterized protein n=1 Tax=bioreactor metagenome TaxID=1076179 RepID=A0A644UZD4_9ZZZZ